MPPPIDPPRPTVLDPTRAEPEPWFVGSGRGLMIGVLSLVAVLLIVRGVSLWWVAERAWAWWRTPAPVGVPPPVFVPAPPGIDRPLPPSREVPPPDARLANRSARFDGDPAAAFSADNYPPAAIRRGEQGRTVARLAVDASGTPTACTIATSSGFDSLDDATCRIALRRARFHPARDARGAAIASHHVLPVRWVLPD